MKEEKLSKKTKILIISLVLILLGLLIYSAVLNNTAKTQQSITNNQQPTTNNNINPNLTTDLNELSTLQQYDRIKYYMDKYLFYIEAQDYQSAYNLLHEDFKQAHFPTLEQFTQYVIQKYPIVNTIEYTDYVKLGLYHVLTIKFSDILNATATTTPSFEQKYIIVENGLNDFKLSFQAE